MKILIKCLQKINGLKKIYKQLKLNKMKKILLLVILAIGFTSCKSGWSCKKRYVKQDKVLILKNQGLC
jgi:hypothetical protein